APARRGRPSGAAVCPRRFVPPPTHLEIFPFDDDRSRQGDLEEKPEAKRIHRSSLIPTNDTVSSPAPLSLLSPAAAAPEFYPSTHSSVRGRVHSRRLSSINLAVFANLEIPHGTYCR